MSLTNNSTLEESIENKYYITNPLFTPQDEDEIIGKVHLEGPL